MLGVNCANCSGHKEEIKYIFAQVINRVGTIADFGHKQGKDSGKQAAHSNPIWEYPPPPPQGGEGKPKGYKASALCQFEL